LCFKHTQKSPFKSEERNEVAFTPFFSLHKTMFENDGGRLVLKLGREENWIREYTTQEIFTRSNLSPFVMFATTKGGKTTIGIDIVHECAHAGFNHFNFITSSYNAPTNTVLRNNVLPQCVIQDEEDICYKLNKVWEESETTPPISP